MWLPSFDNGSIDVTNNNYVVYMYSVHVHVYMSDDHYTTATCICMNFCRHWFSVYISVCDRHLLTLPCIYL